MDHKIRIHKTNGRNFRHYFKRELQYIDFIKPLHQKMEFIHIDDSDQIRKPSEKQIAFAEKLAKENNLELPKDYKENIKVCMDFLEKLKKMLNLYLRQLSK